MEKEKQVKKLLILSLVFFNLTVAVWVLALLLRDETIKYNIVLKAVSLIPMAFYIVYSYKLNTLLEIDKYFCRF